jgi:hypothetical protein
MISRSKQKLTPYCSFCGKAAEQAHCLVAGPHVFICDECIGACVAYLPLRARLNALATMVLPWRWRFRTVRSPPGTGNA